MKNKKKRNSLYMTEHEKRVAEKMYCDGYGYNEIARRMGRGKTTIRRLLCNLGYQVPSFAGEKDKVEEVAVLDVTGGTIGERIRLRPKDSDEVIAMEQNVTVSSVAMVRRMIEKEKGGEE